MGNKLEPKSGKTSLATQFESPLLIAFEKGYNAISGVKALPMQKWADFRTVLKQLRSEEAKAMYQTVIVDTCDIAYDLCEKYILNREMVDKISDIPFGGGYALVEKEYDECLREIALMGYGVVLISHAEDKTFTDESGVEFNKIVPTLNKRARKVALRMADINGYIRNVTDQESGENKTMLYMRGTPRYEAGARFKHIVPCIELSYENLVGAIADAIQKSEDLDGAVVVDTKENNHKENFVYDYDVLMKNAQETISEIMKLDDTVGDNIVSIVESNLGKNKKLSQATREQVEMVKLINDDLNELLTKIKSKK